MAKNVSTKMVAELVLTTIVLEKSCKIPYVDPATEDLLKFTF